MNLHCMCLAIRAVVMCSAVVEFFPLYPCTHQCLPLTPMLVWEARNLYAPAVYPPVYVPALCPTAPVPQMVIACWCQREAGVNGAAPLSSQEQQELNFLYEEWAHPFFISMQEFCRLMEVRRHHVLQ